MKGKIVKPEFEEGKEKEPQNVVAMEKFKDVDINAMSIIVDSIKDHLIPYISHLDSLKKMYDALTNLFSVRNIGQVMSLKNELRDMKMNDDESIIYHTVCTYGNRLEDKGINWRNRNQSHPMSPEWDGSFYSGW
jgi:hypothetical protein